MKKIKKTDSGDYVWEKMLVAIECLCGEGSFKKRLGNATISALVTLENADLTGKLADDLRYILDWTTRNMDNGVIQREPDEPEKRELVEKMLHVLVETTKRQAEKETANESKFHRKN